MITDSLLILVHVKSGDKPKERIEGISLKVLAASQQLSSPEKYLFRIYGEEVGYNVPAPHNAAMNLWEVEGNSTWLSARSEPGTELGAAYVLHANPASLSSLPGNERVPRVQTQIGRISPVGTVFSLPGTNSGLKVCQ